MTEYSQNFIEQIYTIPSYIYMTNNVLKKYISPQISYGQCAKCRHWYKGSVVTHLRHQQYCYRYLKKQAVLTIQRAVIKWLYRPDGSFMKQAKDRYYQNANKLS
jgi:hypothetical protein